MNRLTKLATAVCAACALYAGRAARADVTLDVATDKPGIKVSPTLYGIFFEEINRSGDGGLYGEMIQNRSFEDNTRDALAWETVRGGALDVALSIDNAKPINDQNPHALKVVIKGQSDGKARAGVANTGFAGVNARKGVVYNLSLYARGEGVATLTVSLEGADGKVLASTDVVGVNGAWKRQTVTLTASDNDPKARLIIATKKPGTLWLDMVSMFPKDTFKNRPNGMRPDLAQLVADMKPAFMRFPGGCWVEGETMKFSYRWKETIGDIATRKTNWNIWRYFSTNGLGYHEYLQFCEDIGAEPLFVVNVGMSHRGTTPMDQMGATWMQDALDAVEYANGSTTTKYGALRAAAGHPKPFDLKYMEIGNENGGPAYLERYNLIYTALKAKYPQMKFVACEWAGGHPRNAEIVDEHYYESPQFFMRNATKYDNYDRKGFKVYVGEYAVTKGCGNGNQIAAVGEAAFMTGMERNSDVVVLSSYAPLFLNLGAPEYKTWNPDAICFDASRAYGTPSYYVQKMFASNRADTILPVDVKTTDDGAASAGGAVGAGTWRTQAEFKDLKVEADGKTVYTGDFTGGLGDAKSWKGNWATDGGTLMQTADDEGDFLSVGDANWTDYTYTLKARKTGGTEGFLIVFRAKGQDEFSMWNIGGWANSRHQLEWTSGGTKAPLGSPVAGSVETGRWYDIKIECVGQRVKCYLDGELIHDVTYPSLKPVYTVAGKAGNDLIVKVVNPLPTPQDVTINLPGVKDGAKAMATTLSGEPNDENSFDEPTKVAPKTEEFEAGPSVKRTLPGTSVSVIRVKG